MTTKIVITFAILIFIPLCGCVTTYQTNSIRTETVSGLCVGISNRSELISSNDSTTAEQYNTVMKSSFSATGTDLLKTVMANLKDLNVVLQTYPNLPQEYGLFVGPFVIGLIALLLSCMCSCCCCCCPAACPPCKCCKKQMGQTYSRCQLIWPGVVLILALGLILAAGVVGLSKVKDLQTTISAVGCSVAITLDDIINGNVSTNGKYFVGIQTLYNQMGNIQNNLTNIDTTLTSIVPTGVVAMATTAALTAAKTAIDQLPTGTAAGKYAAYNYKTPFDSAAATLTLPSKMPNDLGSTNAADSTSAIYIAYNGLIAIQDVINQVTGGAQGVKTTIASGFSTALTSAKKILKDVSDTLVSGDKQYYSTYSSISPNFPTINTAVTGIYAGLIGLSAVAMLAALFLLICNVYGCRYLLYFVCVIFVLIGFISFFLSILVSAIIPIFYWTCDALTFAFSSGANFNSIYQFIIGLFGGFVPPNFSGMVTVCIHGQSGDLLGSTALGSAATSLAGLRSFMSNLNSFDATAINTQVDNAWNPVPTLLTNYFSGKLLDFTSSSDQAILQRLSQPTNYPTCTFGTFTTDSWIPTVQTPATISCKSTTGISATNTQCAVASDFTGSLNNCQGCMDAQTVLTVYAGTLSASLTSRYNNAGCNSFISDLGYTFVNYYNLKNTNYNSLTGRTTTAATAVGAYKASITTLGAAFNSVTTSFQATADAILDPNYGILVGLNCAVFGDDLLMVIGTACTHGFILTFFIRAAFGIAGFGILFTICCASCTGVRHYKQMEAKKKSNPDSVKNVTNQTLQDLNPNHKQNSFMNNNNNNINYQMTNKPTQTLPPQNVTYY